MKVRILRAVQNPPEEPRMLTLSPIMGALFPNVRKAAKDETDEATTSAMDRAQQNQRFDPSATVSMTLSGLWSSKAS